MTVPGAVTGLVVTNVDNGASISFIPVVATPAVTLYQYKIGGGSYKDGSTGTPMSITGLQNDVTVQVTLRAVNSDGPGAPSGTVPVTPTDQLIGNENGYDDATVFANPGEIVPHLNFNDPDD